tara:strand:- start:746 stop:976 length:231 start_codon:yes stop_codon:yes gene_type:complete
MPMRRKPRNYQSSNFLIQNPEYHLKYYELLKEARIWNNTAQYWMGAEASRRAKCLANGDIAGYLSCRHSDELYSYL